MTFKFFLVHYRRSTLTLERFETFPTMIAAVDALAESGILNDDTDLEKVLLSADSEETLRVTHSRYFGPTTVESFTAIL